MKIGLMPTLTMTGLRLMSCDAAAPTLIRETESWRKDRNHGATKVRWQFTTKNARIRLRKLYPTL